jgi:hypothetical protein
LARIKSNLIFEPVQILGDGSYLARFYRNAADRKADRHGIVVRIIEYTLDDPGRPRFPVRTNVLMKLVSS